MISSNAIVLVLLFITFLILLVVLILSIVLVRQHARIREQQEVISKLTATNRKLLQSGHASPVVTKVAEEKPEKSPRNDIEANQPIIVISNHSPATKKRSLTNLDEEHKYTELRTGKPNWYVQDWIKLILPYYKDVTMGVDLGLFPGVCKVYVNGRHSWTSNVIDMMSAQALWQAAQNHREISIEPEIPCELVTLTHDELRAVNEMKEIPYTVVKRWEDRELIGKYKCLGIDRQHLIEVKTYRVTEYELRQFADTTTGNSHEETIKVNSREERIIERCPC